MNFYEQYLHVLFVRIGMARTQKKRKECNTRAARPSPSAPSDVTQAGAHRRSPSHNQAGEKRRATTRRIRREREPHNQAGEKRRATTKQKEAFKSTHHSAFIRTL